MLLLSGARDLSSLLYHSVENNQMLLFLSLYFQSHYFYFSFTFAVLERQKSAIPATTKEMRVGR